MSMAVSQRTSLTTMESVRIRETLFIDFDPPTAIAWSANGNLIAVALPPRRETTARVILLEPDSLHEHTVLEVPGRSPRDVVRFLSFSPLHAALTLIAATKEGKILLWTPRQRSPPYQPIALNTWEAEEVEVEMGQLIFCRFLTPPSSYQWPPKDPQYKPASQGIPLEQRFYTMDHIVMDDPAWLRLGVLHFLTLDSSGLMHVHWSALDQWLVTQGQSVSDVLPGELLCADLIGGRGSFLMMAAVSKTNPTIAAVLEIRGHPHLTTSKTVVFVKDRDIGNGSLGDGLVIMQRSAAWVGISKHTAFSHDPLSYTEAKRLVLNLDHLEPENMEKVSMTLSTDGTSLAIWVPETAPSLLSLHSMSITDRLQQRNPSSCLAGVFSPNGVCFAGIIQTEKRFSLEIWSLSEISIGSNGVFESRKSLCMWDCMRTVWALLTHADPWDICQRIQRHALILPQSLAYFSLFYLDGMLHRHPHFSRPQHADLLDKIKIRVFLESQNPTVQVVLIDLYSRRMISTLFYAFTSTFLTSSKSSHLDFSLENWTEGDKESCKRWLQWIAEYFRFLCTCVKTWCVRCANAADETANDVPFIRLLCDNHFVKRLSVLLFCFRRFASQLVSLSSRENEKYQYVKEACCDTMNQIHLIVKKANVHRQVKDQESWEGIEAFRDLVSQTRKTCCGPVHLHYARLDGPITKDVEPMLRQIRMIDEATPWNQTMIETKAIELGLLPDRALKGFLMMKENERRHPLHKQNIPKRLPLFDTMKGRSFTEYQHIFYAADQSCIAGFGAVMQVRDQYANGRPILCHVWMQENEALTSRFEQTMLKQCAARSPFTGCLWKKLHM